MGWQVGSVVGGGEVIQLGGSWRGVVRWRAIRFCGCARGEWSGLVVGCWGGDGGGGLLGTEGWWVKKTTCVLMSVAAEHKQAAAAAAPSSPHPSQL